MCDYCSGEYRRHSRRAFISTGLAAAAAAASPLQAWGDQLPGGQNAIAPAEALRRLMTGNARYAANVSANRDYSAGRAERVKAQYPIAAILSCADSRVAPELIFDQGPGDLFVVRVAGNFVNGAGLASLEYGTKFLGVPLIMVLGHTGCGAIAAAIKVFQDGAKLPGHLPNLVEDIRPGVQAAMARKPKDVLLEAIRENVRYNVAQLRSDQPVIADQVAKGSVLVVGSMYDIATGRVSQIS